MRILGRRLRRVAKYLRGRLAPGSLILMYHRVTEVQSDPWSICVSPQRFAQHMEVLRSTGRVVPLQQLNQTLQQGNPRWQIAVTFDDGYADNLYNAKPLLEYYGIPATMFLTSGYTEHKRDLWWDELDQLLLGSNTLPEVLCLLINGTTYRWELGTAACDSEKEYQHKSQWKVKSEDSSTPRLNLYRKIYDLLSPLQSEARQKIMDELLVWAGCEPVLRSSHRIMNSEEMSTVGQGDLIEIGAHSVTHPFLSFLPANRQWEEIYESKTCLEQITRQKIVSFAYPHGNYSTQTPALVREAGFTSACTTYAQSARGVCDRFLLPRFQVEDWDGEEFARQLSVWKGS
ncbi:MAG: polysaccharide deacetylase family protein [Rhizonema sp. PD37]|nr:polysaccharide deacetylase family protein [Rhizonema sp. PD37]